MKEYSRTGKIKSGEDRKLSGFIPLFRKMKCRGGGYERFSRTAFDETNTENVVLAYNHNLDKTVAGTKNGSLDFKFTADGIEWTAEVAKTSAGDDMLENVRSGLAPECSLRFWVEDGDIERTMDDGGSNYDIFHRVVFLKDLAPTPQGMYSESISRTIPERKPQRNSLDKTFGFTILNLTTCSKI